MPFLTIAGENKIALNQSVNGGLTIINFVLANVPDLGTEPADRIAVMPDPSLIVDTLPFTKRGYVNPNQVVYSLVMGSNLGDYDFNWIGLVDEDGVLVVVSHVPNIQKRKSVGGVPGNTITRNFLIEYTDIQNITATTVPVETWQIDFSDRLNGIDERERLANLDVYGHEGFLDDGWKVTGSAGAYSVAVGIGYVGGIRAKNVTPHEVITSTFPNEIWLNVSLQGDISDMNTMCEFVIDTGPFEDYVDGNGVTHYLTKIADIDAAGEVIDGRVSGYMERAEDYADSGDSATLAAANSHAEQKDLEHKLEVNPHPQYNANLVGAVQGFAASSAPAGWLKANGAEINRSSYASLFEVIGTTFGVGDGETTFNLPDLRGEFIRGWDDGRGVDSGRGFASFQDSDNKSHSHGMGTAGGHTHSYNHGAGSASYPAGGTGYPYDGMGTYSTGYAGDHTHSILNSGGSEARPRNMALLYCIKY